MPLKLMSVSLPCASMVILPALVAKVEAASPVVISSYALDILANDKVPEPSVLIY